MDGFNLRETDEADGHRWAVVDCACSLNAEDPVITAIVDLVRTSYGESEIVKRAERWNEITPDPAVEETFDLDALRNAVRLGMPDPNEEKNKPAQLTNYRSESAEMVARSALAVAYGLVFPPAPQVGKANPNQPILGFDGWALEKLDGEKYAFVLTQVKGTDQAKCPPDEAKTLVEECKRVAHQTGKVARALSMIVLLLEPESEMGKALIGMLELIGQGTLPPLLVAPAIVRGTTSADMGDLVPLRNAASTFMPAKSRCVTVSLGTALGPFGEYVMEQARASV